MMAIKAIFCSTDMVRKIKTYKKTQDRRLYCNYAVGDNLYVCEQFATHIKDGESVIYYRADGELDFIPYWQQASFMRREQARIHLFVTRVEKQRLLDITHGDAIAEGFVNRGEFLNHWDQQFKIYGLPAAQNPLVYMIAFDYLPF